MALVKILEKGIKERENIHSITECKYFTFLDNSGKKILQLDTFGSNKRRFPGKASQSIQFSTEALIQLREILENEIF